MYHSYKYLPFGTIKTNPKKKNKSRKEQFMQQENNRIIVEKQGKTVYNKDKSPFTYDEVEVTYE